MRSCQRFRTATRIAQTPAVRTPHARYRAAAGQAAGIARRLGRVPGRARRAVLLDALAAAAQAMADSYTDVATTGPGQRTGGQYLAGTLTSSAQLIRLVSYAEHALAGTTGPRGPRDEGGYPLDYDPAWVRRCLPFLSALCTERDHTARAGLLEQAATAVTPHVGARAAEVLRTLAHCERQVAGRWYQRALRACAPGRGQPAWPEAAGLAYLSTKEQTAPRWLQLAIRQRSIGRTAHAPRAGAGDVSPPTQP